MFRKDGRTDAGDGGGLTRRSLFARAGAGAAAVGASGVLGAAPAQARPERPDRFTRMFRLPSFAEETPGVAAALMELGRPARPGHPSLLDADDDLAAGPIALIVDPSLSANNPDNPTHTAGTTFFGQFLDHDVTFDASSVLGRATAPRSATNARTPSLDLDSVYGLGPILSPELYHAADMAKLRVESGGLFEDLPRTADGRAIIADKRNDENLMVAGLQAAFLLFHNNVVDRVRARHPDRDALKVYASARRLTTWHYQWMVVHELLPQFVGRAMVTRILGGGARFYHPRRDAAIPVEFQGAAYRFGHSMVRPSYRANLAGDGGGPFFGLVFDHGQNGAADPDDLRGGHRASRRFIGWQTFFDFGDGQVKHNKRIDTKISTPLFHLVPGVVPRPPELPESLAQRNLLRHLTWRMPSGQSIARAMGDEPLSRADLAELAPLGAGLDRHTPLWYYVLREAELVRNGLHLGPVGGRIVAEVIVGLLRADRGSYLSAQPGWRPTLPARTSGDFDMVDFLTFAGVDPASRGQ